MDLSHTAKLLSIYKRGVITAPEFANGVLVDFIQHDYPIEELVFRLTRLPDEVQQTFEDLLRQIERADYHWYPFVFGPGGAIRGSDSEDATRLRQICTTLEVTRSPAPSLPE